MPGSNQSNVWLWKEPDHRWKRDVIDLLKTVEPIDGDIVVLHCTEVQEFDESIPFANYILNMGEMFNVFKKEKAMFLNSKDLCQAIELCLGRYSRKNEEKETKITDEDIINCHKEYIGHFKCKDAVFDKTVSQLKMFIEENNCADMWLMHHLLKNSGNLKQHLSTIKFLILGTPPSDIFKNIILMMVPNEVVLNVLVETPLNISLQGSPSVVSSACTSSTIEVTTEPLCVEEILIDTESHPKLRSATEEYVEHIMASFFSLLVNSRNELALAKVMISPIIDLSHEAFTELKHLASQKEMPMCQTALSYVTRMKLGGKGYAPAADCPMLPHLKTLELFVDVLNQMQTVIEEDLTPISAVKRLINILKKKLLRCGSDKLRPSAIESASENLKNIAVKVLNVMKSEKLKNSSPQVCQENLDFLHYFVNYINCCCLTFDPKRILLQKHTKRTPISLPPLLGYFRSPEEELSCDAASILDEDSIISNKSMSFPPPVSYFHYSESSSVSMTCVDSLTPSKMSFKGCLTIENDESFTETKVFKTPKKSNSTKGRKRSILGEITNENPPCKTKKVEVKKKNVEVKSKQVEEKTKKAEKKTNLANRLELVKEITKESVPKKELKTKSKVSKKFKLIEGQGKITSFFNMK